MTAAERQRRWRARQKKGVAVHHVEVGEDVYWALEASKLVSEGDLSNSSAVARACGKALREWAELRLCDALRIPPIESSISTSS